MPEHGRIPVPLRLCRGCQHFVRIENEACDFFLEAAHQQRSAEIQAMIAQLRGALTP